METLELKLIEKRLSKYSADQLFKKYEADNFSSPEEKEIAMTILLKRGKLQNTLVKREAPADLKEVVIVEKVKEPAVELAKKELSILEEAIKCLDELYEKNDVKINKRLLDVFGDQDVDDYSELKDVQLITIIQIHKEIFHPELIVKKDPEPVKKVVKEAKKEVKPKAESVKKENRQS